MKLFDAFKALLPSQQTPVVAEPTPKPRAPKKTEKELATERGDPYVAILSMEVDPENLHQGAFELDWNEKFILNLSRVGYQMKENDKESDIIDRWFQSVCRNVALEVYEQAQADPENRDLRKMNTKDLGNGRSEVS